MSLLFQGPCQLRKTAQNSKYDILVLRRAGVRLQGLDFDTMLASYVLDPGRRSHGLDVLAAEFLDYTMTPYADVCGKGKSLVSFDESPLEAARNYSCEEADMTLRLRAIFEPQLENTNVQALLDEIAGEKLERDLQNVTISAGRDRQSSLAIAQVKRSFFSLEIV